MKLFKNLFTIAIKNVWLHRKHSLAAMISISAGFISLVIFQGYMKDVDLLYYDTFRLRFMYGDGMIEHKQAMTVEGKSNPEKFWITPETQNFLKDFFAKESALIESTVPVLRVAGMAVTPSGSAIFRGLAMDLAAGAKTRGPLWQWNTVYGAPLEQASSEDSLLVGQSLGHMIGCDPVKKHQILNSSKGYKAENHPFTCQAPTVQVQSMTLSGQVNALDLEVVGMVDAAYKEIDDKYVTMSLKNGQALLNTDLISYQTVKLKDPTEADAFIARLNKALDEAQLPYHMVRWQDHEVGDLYWRTMDLLSIFRNFVVIIIISIAGLSVFNVMVKVVRERTREIGILQSIGFYSWQIKTIFLMEAVLLSILGCVAGAVLSIVSTWILNALGIAYKAGVLVEPVPFRVMIVGSLYLWATLLLSCIAVFTALIAVQSTMKKRVSDNLNFS